MPIRDTATGYGWLSIALHWFTAVAVIVLLFIGDTISTLEGDERADALHLHTSLAMTAYVFLWARIILRFRYGHPGPLPRQRGVFFVIGKVVHYLLLLAIAAMLISGPLMVWLGGAAIRVWNFEIPTPFETHSQLRMMMHSVHARAAAAVLILTILHLIGVYKHAAFNHDGTFGKMLVPAAPDGTPEAEAGGRPDGDAGGRHGGSAPAHGRAEPTAQDHG